MCEVFWFSDVETKFNWIYDSLLDCFQWHTSVFWQLHFKRKALIPHTVLHLLTTTVVFNSQNSQDAVYTHQIQLNSYADHLSNLLFGKVSCSHLNQHFSSIGIVEYSLAVSSDHTISFIPRKWIPINITSQGKKELIVFTFLPPGLFHLNSIHPSLALDHQLLKWTLWTQVYSQMLWRAIFHLYFLYSLPMRGLTDPSKYSKRARFSNNSTGQYF
jgi:hypothetical protein